MPMPKRVQPIVEFPTPTRKDELQRFIGMMTYYSRFIPHIQHILLPLHAAVGNKAKDKKAIIEWSTECEMAFTEAKKALANATLLQHPSPTEETRLATDASGVAVGGKLEQKTGNGWVPIAFFSKKLKTSEKSTVPLIERC